MERYSPGDVFELTESYQKLQRIVCTTQGYQISCSLLHSGRRKSKMVVSQPSCAYRFLGPSPTDCDSANLK